MFRQKWFNARELAGLPGLPASEKGVQLKAKREHWQGRKRKGLGGGTEYYLKTLPAETRNEIESQQESLAKSVSLDNSDQETFADRDRQLREIINAQIKQSEFSREQICDRMSEILETKITINQLNNWTALSKPAHRFPASVIDAFCLATKSLNLVRFIFQNCASVADCEAEATSKAIEDLENKKIALQVQALENQKIQTILTAQRR